MKITKLTQLYFFLIVIVLTHIASSTSFGGRNNNTACGGCHGSGNSGMMTLSGIPSSVTPSTTYPAQLCITDAVNPNGKGGFRLWFQNATASNYSNLESTVKIGGSGSNLGLTHNNAPTNIVAGNVCWSFDWTSLPSGNNNLLVYGNAADGDGNNNVQDQGGYFMQAVIPTVDPCATDITILDNPIPSGTYQSSNSITANTPLANSSVVVFDTPNCVDLQSDFEVPLGADFETTIGAAQGCLTTSNSVTNVFYDTKEWLKTE